jgi:hypothetical protein
LAGLVFAGVLMYLCHLGARRRIGTLLRTGPSARKFELLFGAESFPHGDTLGKLFRRLDPGQFQEVVCGLAETLIRSKVLYPHRLLDRYFVVAVDGTGHLYFQDRHCPHCLTQTHQGQTLYYHPVLEAKLVTPNGLAVSLMTEFIENPNENATKQDCELAAFYRLARRLKLRFPRLPLLLTLDGLFAGGPTFQLCQQYGWALMVVLKDSDLPSVNAEFEALAKLQIENQLRFRTGKNGTIHQHYRWVDELSYLDSENREHLLSVLECRETKPGKKEKETTTTFKWITNLKLTRANVIPLAENGGRIRWKIENQGFNTQKNGGYGLEHAYSKNPNSVKIFYFLLQIAHLVAQLMEKGSLLKKLFPKGVGSLKDLALLLLEAWRTAPFSPADLLNLQTTPIQIRFDTS